MFANKPVLSKKANIMATPIQRKLICLLVAALS